jgi:RNA polymerase sigma factor (sigma-70 family)
VSDTQDTVWAVIDRARRGDGEARSLFAHRYEPVVRAYFVARWRGTPLSGDVDDALQEVFVDFLNGALDGVDPERPFRPFLYGVARVVALRTEERRARDRGVALESEHVQALESDDDAASVVFDRAWAEALVQEAKALQAKSASGNEAARRRVELLELRFGEGLPIRSIAQRFGEDPDRVHRQYAQARLDFLRALREVVRRHHAGGEGAEGGVDAECSRLLACFA